MPCKLKTALEIRIFKVLLGKPLKPMPSHFTHVFSELETKYKSHVTLQKGLKFFALFGNRDNRRRTKVFLEECKLKWMQL